MALMFHYLSGSPFAWKVWLALEHKGAAYDLRVVSRDAGDLTTPAFHALNPYGKAPVIEHDGFALFESSAIVEYLEEALPGPSLWPASIQDRANARRIMAESQTSLYPPVRRLVDALLLNGGAPPDEAVVSAASKDATHCASILAQSLHASFFGGGEPGAADYSVYPLSAIMARLSTIGAATRPHLDLPDAFIAWRERMRALPIVAATQPPHWRQT
ncbi:MAG TPA: hypothetical protein DHW63_13090 [Hyphomonadaceae bacterium]|nr:hypothetical protein [Hyphomonadaceae bacterium]